MRARRNLSAIEAEDQVTATEGQARLAWWPVLLQVVGVVVIAAGVGLLAIWAGVVVAGVGITVAGTVAELERRR
jgi:hypothetical protein